MIHTRSLLLAASALALLTLTGCMVWPAAQSVELARQREPLQVQPVPMLRVLVVGDSTAVGT